MVIQSLNQYIGETFRVLLPSPNFKPQVFSMNESKFIDIESRGDFDILEQKNLKKNGDEVKDYLMFVRIPPSDNNQGFVILKLIKTNYS